VQLCTSTCVNWYASLPHTRLYALNTPSSPARLLGLFAELLKTALSFAVSVFLPAWIKLGIHWRDFHEIWYLSIYPKSVGKVQFFFLNRTRIRRFLREYLCTLLTISHSVLLTIRNVSVNKLYWKSEYTFYEGWNFNSGNYLFTTDTK